MSERFSMQLFSLTSEITMENEQQQQFEEIVEVEEDSSDDDNNLAENRSYLAVKWRMMLRLFVLFPCLLRRLYSFLILC